MNMVFIVTSGNYSDYRINAVFSKRELAEEYCRRAGKGYEIAKWKLDEPLPDTYYRIAMKRDGNVLLTFFPAINQQEGFQYFEEACFCASHNMWEERGDVLVWCVKTDDRERAIKVVNEKRAQILALNIWGDRDKVCQIFG